MNNDVRLIIERLVEEKKAKVSVELINKQVEFNVYEPRFSDIRSMLVFDSSEQGVHIEAPFLDESEHSKKRFTGQLDKERSDLPGKGFFARISSSYHTEVFGLLIIEHEGLKIMRKQNDYRYNEYRRIYKEYAYFLFDDEEKKYVQCMSDEINKVERLTRTHSLKEIVAMNKFDELTIEFYRRKEKAFEMMTEIQAEYEAMRDRLYNLLYSDKKNFNLSSETIKIYLQDVKHFLKDDYKALTGCYLLSNRINEEEYDFHLKTLREALERFNDVVIFYKQNQEKFSSAFEVELNQQFAEKMSYFKKLFSYKKTTSNDNSNGYFIKELRNGNAFRTLVQIDVEHIYAVEDESDSHFNQMRMREALIKRFAK